MSEIIPQQSRFSMRKLLILTFKLALGLAILYWLIIKGRLDYTVYREVLAGPNGWLLLGVLAGQGFSIVLMLARWWILLQAQDIPISLRHVLGIGFRGAFANLFVPGGLGVDGMRLLYLQRHHREKLVVGFSSLVLDRLLAFIALLLLGIGFGLALLFVQYNRWTVQLIVFNSILLFALLALGAVVCGFLPLVIVGWLRRFKIIDEAIGAMHVYRNRRLALVLCLLTALIGHFSNCISACFALVTLGFSGKVLGVFAVTPVIILARMIPLTPLGLGISDSVAEEMYLMAGMEGGAEVHMLRRATSILIFLVCGLTYLTRDRTKPRMKHG